MHDSAVAVAWEKYMSTISSAELRERLADVLDRVAFGKERLVVTRRGRRIAAVVPIEDVEALERSPGEAEPPGEVAARVRSVRGRYRHVPTSSDAFAARKQAEKDAEDR
jgi:prevent-host-death family protein